jgi:hypothetical protein
MPVAWLTPKGAVAVAEARKQVAELAGKIMDETGGA